MLAVLIAGEIYSKAGKVPKHEGMHVYHDDVETGEL